MHLDDLYCVYLCWVLDRFLVYFWIFITDSVFSREQGTGTARQLILIAIGRNNYFVHLDIIFITDSDMFSVKRLCCLFEFAACDAWQWHFKTALYTTSDSGLDLLLLGAARPSFSWEPGRGTGDARQVCKGNEKVTPRLATVYTVVRRHKAKGMNNSTCSEVWSEQDPDSCRSKK